MAGRTMLVLASCVLFAGGCMDMSEVAQFRDRTARLRDDSKAESAAWEQRIGAMRPDDPMRPDAEAALSRARAKEAAAEAAVKQVDLVVSRAANPDDPLGRTIGAASPLLPEPVRLPLALGAALIASLARAAQLKRGMVSIATGLNKAMEEDDQFKAGFKRHANTFRAIQTPAAKKAVDQSKRVKALRIPV